MGGADSQQLVELGVELVRIDTVNPPGRELAAATRLAGFLEAAGLEVSLLPFGEERANLIARIKGSGERASLLLSGHLDTVPIHDPEAWSYPPLGGEVHGDRLYGRGALDMKGALAAMSIAAARLVRSGRRPAGDVVLGFTAGEETDSCGASRICAEHRLDDVGMAVVGEPTNLDVGIAHRGALWIRVETEGDAGHGSQPAVGRNAVKELLAWLHPHGSLEQLIAQPVDPVLGAGTVSLNIIGGGNSANMRPASAYAVLDFRTVPGADHGEIVRALEARGGAVRLTVLRDCRPIETPADHPLVRTAVAAVEATGVQPVTRGLPYMTDGSVFVEALTIPTVILGPGIEHDAHTDDESVTVRSLERAAAIYESMAFQLQYDPSDQVEE